MTLIVLPAPNNAVGTFCVTPCIFLQMNADIGRNSLRSASIKGYEDGLHLETEECRTTLLPLTWIQLELPPVCGPGPGQGPRLTLMSTYKGS